MSKRFATILIVLMFAFIELVGIEEGMNGRVQAAPYTIPSNPSPNGTSLFISTCWIIEEIDDASGDGYDTSLALDSNDRPHISYYDDTNNDLKYAHWDATSWQITTVDSAGAVGNDTSLALDSNDRPHISYHDNSNNDLKYAHLSSSCVYLLSPASFCKNGPGWLRLALTTASPIWRGGLQFVSLRILTM